MHFITSTIILTIFLLLSTATRGEDAVETPFPEPHLTIQFVDEQGKPVAGAHTGQFARIREFDEKTGAKWEFAPERLQSDANGIVQFAEPNDYRGVVFARHPERRLVAVKRVDPEEHDGPVPLTMHPECHVIWRISCEELENTKQGMGKIRGLAGSENVLALWMYTDSHTLHAFLPPGEFSLVAAGDRINPMAKTIVIKKDQREYDTGVTDVVAKPWTLLIGKSAPEITDVADWKNGPPVKLADLRGKVVLLDFWGWWCGPCVYGGIPELMKLREDYRREDLAIIGIHTPHGDSDEVDSAKELEEKLAEVRSKVWDGKEIPFPVAITRYRELAYFPGGEPIANCRMNVNYGINGFPTAVVIDRDGNLVGLWDMRQEEDRAKLQQLIDAE